MKTVMNSVISLTMVFSFAVAEMNHEVPIKGRAPQKASNSNMILQFQWDSLCLSPTVICCDDINVLSSIGLGSIII